MSKTHIPVSMKLDAMLYRVVAMMLTDEISRTQYMRAGIFCGICNEPLEPGQRIHFDHTHPEGLGGKTTYVDIRPVHYDPCHKKKTSGTKATSAGSDVHKIAKAKRIARGGKTKRGRPMKGRGFSQPVRKRPWPKRPMGRS